MFTWVYFFLPCFDFGLTCGRHGLHYTFYERFDLLSGWKYFWLLKKIQVYNNRKGPWDHSARLGFLLRFVDRISNISPMWNGHTCLLHVLQQWQVFSSSQVVLHLQPNKTDQKNDKKDGLIAARTRFVEGFSLRLTFKENVWPDLWTWVGAWCLPESKHPPLKQLKHTSTPKGLSWEMPGDRCHISRFA